MHEKSLREHRLISKRYFFDPFQIACPYMGDIELILASVLLLVRWYQLLGVMHIDVMQEMCIRGHAKGALQMRKKSRSGNKIIDEDEEH